MPMPQQLDNPSPHATGCPATVELTQLGIAMYCPLCNRRIGFLPKAQAKEQIARSIESDFEGY